MGNGVFSYWCFSNGTHQNRKHFARDLTLLAGVEESFSLFRALVEISFKFLHCDLVNTGKFRGTFAFGRMQTIYFRDYATLMQSGWGLVEVYVIVMEPCRHDVMEVDGEKAVGKLFIKRISNKFTINHCGFCHILEMKSDYIIVVMIFNYFKNPFFEHITTSEYCFENKIFFSFKSFQIPNGNLSLFLIEHREENKELYAPTKTQFTAF